LFFGVLAWASVASVFLLSMLLLIVPLYFKGPAFVINEGPRFSWWGIYFVWAMLLFPGQFWFLADDRVFGVIEKIRGFF
jgi:hypothetical protein